MQWVLTLNESLASSITHLTPKSLSLTFLHMAEVTNCANPLKWFFSSLFWSHSEGKLTLTLLTIRFLPWKSRGETSFFVISIS